jgi:hypothetical protein
VLNSFTDWFLPSLNELSELNKNRGIINGLDVNYYWSSTEGTPGIEAYYLDLTADELLPALKTASFGVRPVRAF